MCVHIAQRVNLAAFGWTLHQPSSIVAAKLVTTLVAVTVLPLTARLPLIVNYFLFFNKTLEIKDIKL